MRDRKTSRLLAAVAGAWALMGASPAAHATHATHRVVNATFACQDTTCDAELWLPVLSRGAARPPVIIMAHGLGALKDWGLQPYAERFVTAGFAVVRFDYRGFGRSGGQPRRVVDAQAQVQDWLAAIDQIRLRGDVDGQRLGLWGTSYSGGEVLVAAAERPGAVKAVSAQVPFVSGWSSSLRYPLRHLPQATWLALRDRLRSNKEAPLYVPVLAEAGQDGVAVLICAECAEGYRKLVPANVGAAERQVAARVFLSLPFFWPGRRAEDILAPTLIVAAEQDGLIPLRAVREVAHELKHGEYLELAGANHFSLYSGPVFEQVVARQLAFFRKNLMGLDAGPRSSSSVQQHRPVRLP